MLVDGNAYLRRRQRAALGLRNVGLPACFRSSTTSLQRSMPPPPSRVRPAIPTPLRVRAEICSRSLRNATFVLCASGSAGFTIYDSDLDISVEYLNSPVTITAPKLSDEAMLSCEKAAAPASVSSTTLALLTRQLFSSSSRRNLQSALTFSKEQNFDAENGARWHLYVPKDAQNVFIRPYDAIAISATLGLGEAISDTISINSLKRNDREFTTLLDFFTRHFGDPSTPGFDRARSNFVSSMAGYAIVCYLLQVKDRHDGNILLDAEGHIIQRW
ncbi:unnamed protein product [Peronospora destructor]|uniref:PI3K/PI4K catalytic domain-containing protein n=1 Tax=Peronospora destructor TaxID=86335 RepID=A0AAV0UAZ4_9STRA|nr:unnamed protein product [Peronospora destructor]